MAICWERAVPLGFHLCCLYFSVVLVVRVPKVPFWCLGLDVEFDCIGSSSLPFYLLFKWIKTFLNNISQKKKKKKKIVEDGQSSSSQPYLRAMYMY